MKLKYIRLAAFSALKKRYSPRARARRMRSFLTITRVDSTSKILDLGGTPAIWEYIEVPLAITLLNLPGETTGGNRSHSIHKFADVEGDACQVAQFLDGEFDLVFSNSVIEHVGNVEKMADFASEVHRLGKSYWIQTPSKWFPIEAHCGMPFWWFYPKFIQERFIAGWRKKLPAWTDMVAGTRVLSLSQLQELFPEAKIQIEFWFCFPKSYVAYYIAKI